VCTVCIGSQWCEKTLKCHFCKRDTVLIPRNTKRKVEEHFRGRDKELKFQALQCFEFVYCLVFYFVLFVRRIEFVFFYVMCFISHDYLIQASLWIEGVPNPGHVVVLLVHISMFELNVVSVFINQHVCTTICIPNHVSVSAPTHYGVCWHHLQGSPSNRQLFAARPMVANNLVDRSLQDRRLCNTDAELRKPLNFLQCVYVWVCWNRSCVFWRSWTVPNLVPSDRVVDCNWVMCVLCLLVEVPLSIIA
jgi:hypothetical protein